jgi:hypothetical protein
VNQIEVFADKGGSFNVLIAEACRSFANYTMPFIHFHPIGIGSLLGTASLESLVSAMQAEQFMFFSSPGTYDCRQVNCRHHRQILLFLLGRLVESMKADLTSLLVWYENVRNHTSTEQSTHHVELTACS